MGSKCDKVYVFVSVLVSSHYRRRVVCKEGFFTRESTKMGQMGQMGHITLCFISMVGGRYDTPYIASFLFPT